MPDPIALPATVPGTEYDPPGVVTLFAGLYVKETRVPLANTVLRQHRHTFPHLSVIASGAAAVWCDGEYLGEFRAPALVKIRPGAEHHFATTEPDTCVLCVHAEAAEDADEAEERLIQKEHV